MKKEKLKVNRLTRALEKIEEKINKDNLGFVHIISVEVFSDNSWSINGLDDKSTKVMGESFKSLNKWSEGVLNEK